MFLNWESVQVVGTILFSRLLVLGGPVANIAHASMLLEVQERGLVPPVVIPHPRSRGAFLVLTLPMPHYLAI